jgi:hypothetical protein
MAKLVLLTNGCMDLGLNASGLTEGLNLDSRWREGRSILSWHEEFLDGTHVINRPEVIVVDKAKIYLSPGNMRGGRPVMTVSIETPDQKQMPMLIECTIAYIGGKISTFDLSPTQPNSFVGGVANDIKRLAEFVRRRWNRIVARVKFGFKYAI